MMKIAHIALAFGLLTQVSPEVYAAGLVLNANELRNDLSWLSNRRGIHLSLSTLPLSQEEISQTLKKAQPSHSSEQGALPRIKQRLSSLKSHFRVSGYTSPDKLVTPQGARQTQLEDSSLFLAFKNSDEWWSVHLHDNVEDCELISNGLLFNANSACGALKFWDQWLSFGQMIGQYDAGGLPSAITFLGGMEGKDGLGKVAINWSVQAHDTSSNMRRTNYICPHHIDKDGFYQQGYHLVGDAMGADGQLFAGKVELVREDNQRWSTDLAYVKVNLKNQSISMAFPHSDSSKGV